MKEKDTRNKQSRATFEDTIKHQEKLLELIDEHITNNTCISDTETRKKHFRLLGRATVGIGTDSIKLRFNNNHTVIEIPNFEQLLGVLFYHDSNKITDDFWFKLLGKTINCNIDIKDIWEQVRIHLLGIFPIAKASTIRMSKELIDIKKKINMVNTVEKNG